jgi:hypothetical protein
MSRDALLGIGRVIKANTSVKSIETLQAEGKKRVRVVSSERVMAIIQAIVDDTINAEVGEITSRDRERIVSDTQERFSRVLKMQQDLEQQVEELRGSLRAAETERERLRSDKALLEAQCETARRVEGESDGAVRLSRELAGVRETVERSVLDVAERQAQAETKLSQRLEREFRSVAVCLAQIHEDASRAPAAADALVKLRGDFDAFECRILGVERGSSELSEHVSRAVLERLEEREAAAGDRRGTAAGVDAAQLTETLRRLQHSSDGARQSVLDELAMLRGSVDESRTHAASVRAEQFRELEQRLDGALADLRGEFAALATRTVESAARQHDAVQALREHLAQNATSQSDALATGFKGALETALDKITRTMASATARPIETNVEATDVLLAKIFDARDGEVSSNLDQLDVEQRRSRRSILSSVDRLKQMSGAAGNGAQKPA